MPPPELEKAASAGVSAPPQVDVAALVERLREELAGGANGVAADRGRLVAVRHRAERVWAVTAERPLPRRPGLKGLVAHPVKRALRPFLRWYVEPLAAEQRMFNDAVLRLLDGLLEELERTVKAHEAASRTVAELEERLTRVERSGPSAASPTVAAQQRADAIPDYS